MQTLASIKALSLAATPDDRRNLVLAITQAFDAVQQMPSNDENALFCEVVGRILDQLTESVRAEVAEKLAPMERTPDALVYKMANDDAIAVAGPVLEQSTKLTAAQLVEIAENRDDSYRMAIAKRASLPEAVTDVIVEKSGREVLQAISGNRGAVFSQSGVGVLLERGGGDATVQQNLLARSRDDESIAGKIRDALTEGLSKKLGDFVSRLPAAEMDHAVEIAQQAYMAEKGAARRTRMARKLMLDRVNSGKMPVDQAISQLSREKRIDDIGWLAAQILQVSEQIAKGALAAPEVDTAVIIARALGLNEATFRLVAMARCRALSLADDTVDAAVREFSAVSQMEANRAIRLLKLR
ncbi:DUF2336 domain-containing protein [Stappia sp. ES.058]|uniref:DUF2336 domain-containing protein n=1 Tax=Stappia sp. ES.058 TaxID=1881061 RepID=UPI00087DD250|nr:DUF2336 domain-containing protein [Stappia sp. ES.058]SDU41049.1 hypothetical protein SAMN05428979_3573 [Stappia sp. ES.058]